MPTFRARISKTQKGFTLIELMITLAIIAFVVAMVIPRLGKSLGTQIRSTTRKMVVLSSELHHLARVKNRTYRIVIDFGAPGGSPPRFFVESASTKQLLNSPDATPTPTRIVDRDKAPPPAFQKDEVLKKPIELPTGISWEDVETEYTKQPIKEGKAFIHFFPEGLVEQAIIHLTDGKNIHWSLIINPLTGQTTVRQEYVKLKDLQP